MTRQVAILTGLLCLIVAPVSAQIFGGVVFDPTNHANALLRYAELQRAYTQLVTTYQQIRTQYLLLLQQAQRLPVDMSGRYRTVASPWGPFTAPSAYGLTTGWISTATTGQAASAAYARATQALRPYGGALGRLSAEEAARVKARVDRIQLGDASVVYGLTALGALRARETSVEMAMRNLEADTYAARSDFHTQIAVLNKINATAVTAARLAKDTNHLLVSLLEHQLLEATERREAVVQGINAHIAFESDARSLLAATTAHTTTALTTFRIP